MASITTLTQVPLDSIRPTQMSVGRAEVELKHAQWARMGKKALSDHLASALFPAVLGPGREPYIVDHHHLGIALIECGIKTVPVNQLDDLSYLEPAVFWRVMDFRQLSHPFDASGQRRPATELPKHLTDLVDDPYRSLAGAVRRAGGYSKESTPFAEFLWADYFRPLFAADALKPGPDGALAAAVIERATTLARLPAARYLPGYSGEHADH